MFVILLNAHYKDENHNSDIIIKNINNKLFFELDGIKFIGTDFMDFELENSEDYEKLALKYGKANAYVQETYVCENFEIRLGNIGYRGGIYYD